jgi:hypothetical protein
MICKDHLAKFMMSAADLADQAGDEGRIDIADIEIEKTSMALDVKIIQETDKAWKVQGMFIPSFFIKKGNGEVSAIETTQWIPKSKCSIISDDIDTIAIIPNWLMRKIAETWR